MTEIPPSVARQTTESPDATLAAIREELRRLNAQRLYHNEATVARSFRNALLRGLAFGLGSALGATFLFSVVVYLLSTIDFIPIIGEWAREIANQIRTPQ